MNFCPHCGTKTRTPEDRFCSNCGAVLQPDDTELSTEKTNLSSSDTSFAPIVKTTTDNAGSAFVAEFTAPPKKQDEKELAVNPDALATDLLASISRSSTQGKYKTPLKPEPVEKNLFPSEKPATDSSLDRTQVFALPSLLGTEETLFNQPAENTQPVMPTTLFDESPLNASSVLEPQDMQDSAEETPAPISEFVFEAEELTSAHSFTPTENTPSLFEEEPSSLATPEETEQEFFENSEEANIVLVEEQPHVTQKHTAEKAAKLAQMLSAEEEPVSPQPSLESLLNAKEEDVKISPPPLPPLPPASRKKRDTEFPEEKKSVGKKIASIFLGLIVFIIATAGVTLGMLYWNNRPSKTVDQFINSLQAHNYAALNETVAVTGFAATNEGWDALSVAFSSPEQVVSLRQALEKKPGESRSYTAITLTKEPLFLFINRYYIQLSAVEILIPGAAENTQLNLGNTPVSGRLTNEGVLYSGIMPGMYTAALAAPGQEAGASFTIQALESLFPNSPDATAIGQTVTIENCISDDAIIYVNSVAVPEVPVNGVVTIANVPLGSEIIIVAQKDGATMQAQVIFSDVAGTALRFENYQTMNATPASSSAVSQAATAQPTQAEIDSILSTFYTSYLTSINEQSISHLQLSTQSNSKDIESRIQIPGNKDNTFTFISAQCDPASIVAGEENGVPTVSFNATFGFSFKPRDNSAEATNSSSRRTIQLIFSEDKWMVNRLVPVSDANFDAHKLADAK